VLPQLALKYSEIHRNFDYNEARPDSSTYEQVCGGPVRTTFALIIGL
jgi:hypothetical protein